MEIWVIPTIIGTILIPLMGFMLALRPFIKDSIKSELGTYEIRMLSEVKDIKLQISGLERELAGFKEGQKSFIELYKVLSKPGNPHFNKEILLEKLNNDTITQEEARYLQQILTEEKEQAEKDNNILKAIIIIGVLVLIGIVLTKGSK